MSIEEAEEAISQARETNNWFEQQSLLLEALLRQMVDLEFTVREVARG